MKKMIFLVMMMAFSMTQTAFGQSWRAELHAGASSVFAGADYKGYLSSGYFRLGGDVVFGDDDEEEYQMADGRFTIGSDTLAPGLLCELGLKALVGNVEDGPLEGDISAVGFIGSVAYFLPSNLLPIPVRLSATIAGASEPLSMIDLDSYSEIALDASFFIVENAAMVMGYHNHHFKMDNDGGWKLNDDSLTIGIELNF